MTRIRRFIDTAPADYVNPSRIDAESELLMLSSITVITLYVGTVTVHRTISASNGRTNRRTYLPPVLGKIHLNGI